jgi:hypothetical protein
MLRHFSRLLGWRYDGETEGEKYFVDMVCDLVVDCTYPFSILFPYYLSEYHEE